MIITINDWSIDVSHEWVKYYKTALVNAMIADDVIRLLYGNHFYLDWSKMTDEYCDYLADRVELYTDRVIDDHIHAINVGATLPVSTQILVQSRFYQELIRHLVRSCTNHFIHKVHESSVATLLRDNFMHSVGKFSELAPTKVVYVCATEAYLLVDLPNEPNVLLKVKNVEEFTRMDIDPCGYIDWVHLMKLGSFGEHA